MRTRFLSLTGIVGLVALPAALSAQAMNMDRHNTPQAINTLVSHRTELALTEPQVAWLGEQAARLERPESVLVVVGFDRLFGKSGTPRLAWLPAKRQTRSMTTVVVDNVVPGKAGVRALRRQITQEEVRCPLSILTTAQMALAHSLIDANQ